jgi:catechol 2,3-dioxygenase-like lactoylglutathione lyase family enzyme
MTAPNRPGLPGLNGLDHVGLTVPDIEEATRFLVEVLGCEYLYSLPPILDRGAWMREHLNVDPAAEIAHLRFFRCGSSPVFEVFEYAAPHQSSIAPRNSDVGGHHFALYVTDIDAAVDYLRGAGVAVSGEPTASTGPHLGQRWVYFTAPWGAQFELVSYPAGRAWYREHGIEEPSLRAASNGSTSTSQGKQTEGTAS